jgi:hypothetical protein
MNNLTKNCIASATVTASDYQHHLTDANEPTKEIIFFIIHIRHG